MKIPHPHHPDSRLWLFPAAQLLLELGGEDQDALELGTEDQNPLELGTEDQDPHHNLGFTLGFTLEGSLTTKLPEPQLPHPE